MARQIFISHATPDDASVEILAAHLREAGHEVWHDARIVGGQDWWDAILRRLRDHDVFLVALSDSFLGSTACRLEVEYAAALGKPILPVLVRPLTSDSAVPDVVARRQRVDYVRPNAWSAIRLTTAVAELPVPLPLPKLLPPPPDPPPTPLGPPIPELRASTGAVGPWSVEIRLVTEHGQHLLRIDQPRLPRPPWMPSIPSSDPPRVLLDGQPLKTTSDPDGETAAVAKLPGRPVPVRVFVRAASKGITVVELSSGTFSWAIAGGRSDP